MQFSNSIKKFKKAGSSSMSCQPISIEGTYKLLLTQCCEITE